MHAGVCCRLQAPDKAGEEELQSQLAKAGPAPGITLVGHRMGAVTMSTRGLTVQVQEVCDRRCMPPWLHARVLAEVSSLLHRMGTS